MEIIIVISLYLLYLVLNKYFPRTTISVLFFIGSIMFLLETKIYPPPEAGPDVIVFFCILSHFLLLLFNSIFTFIRDIETLPKDVKIADLFEQYPTGKKEETKKEE